MIKMGSVSFTAGIFGFRVCKILQPQIRQLLCLTFLARLLCVDELGLCVLRASFVP
jgi:hypothetical protein